MLTTFTLQNGLRVSTRAIPNTKRTCIGVTVHTGSRNDESNFFGLHHFAEHTPFRGTKKYPTALSLNEPLERYYGNISATTGFSKTDYWAELPSDKSNLAASLISELVFSGIPTLLEQVLVFLLSNHWVKQRFLVRKIGTQIHSHILVNIRESHDGTFA